MDNQTNLLRADTDAPAADAVVAPEKEESRSRIVRSMERFSAMMQVGPGRDPFVEKMTPEHVTAVIANKDKNDERKHAEEIAKIGNHKWYSVGGAVFIFALCGLFLGFHQTEHLDAIIGTLAGLVGGFGLGKVSQHSEKHS